MEEVFTLKIIRPKNTYTWGVYKTFELAVADMKIFRGGGRTFEIEKFRVGGYPPKSLYLGNGEMVGKELPF